MFKIQPPPENDPNASPPDNMIFCKIWQKRYFWWCSGKQKKPKNHFCRFLWHRTFPPSFFLPGEGSKWFRHWLAAAINCLHLAEFHIIFAVFDIFSTPWAIFLQNMPSPFPLKLSRNMVFRRQRIPPCSPPQNQICKDCGHPLPFPCPTTRLVKRPPLVRSHLLGCWLVKHGKNVWINFLDFVLFFAFFRYFCFW